MYDTVLYKIILYTSFCYIYIYHHVILHHTKANSTRNCCDWPLGERGANTKMSYRALKKNVLPSEFLVPIFRFRFEAVGKNLKPMKVYVATAKGLALKKNRPRLVAKA